MQLRRICALPSCSGFTAERLDPPAALLAAVFGRQDAFADNRRAGPKVRVAGGEDDRVEAGLVGRRGSPHPPPAAETSNQDSGWGSVPLAPVRSSPQAAVVQMVTSRVKPVFMRGISIGISWQ